MIQNTNTAPPPFPDVIRDEVRETAHRRRRGVEIEAIAPILPPETIPNVLEQGRIDEVRETAHRRRIRVELDRMGKLLATSPLHDEMTEGIRNWHQQLMVSISLAQVNFDSVVNEFIVLLQDLLRDPICQAPLDKKAKLGSDGHTYGRMSLTVFLNSIPEEYRHRSPFDLENPESSFTIEPHPVVKEMIKWLDHHGSLLHSQEIENAYRELVAQGRRPILPTRETERVRLIRERSLQRRRRRENLNRQLTILRVEQEEEIQERFGAIREQIEVNHQNNQDRLVLLQETNEQRMRRMEEPIEGLLQQLQELRNRNEEEIRRRLGEPDEMEVNAEEILGDLQERNEQGNRNLDERVNDLHQRIQEVMMENVEEALARIAERENEEIGNLDEVLDALQQREVERAQAREQQINAFDQTLREIANHNEQQIQQNHEVIRRRIQEVTEGDLQRLDAVEIHDRNSQRELQQSVEHMNIQARQVQQKNEELERQRSAIDKGIAETKEANAKLGVAIKKVKKAIKKRNQNWEGFAISALLSAAGTWGVQELLSMAIPNVQGSISSLQGGSKLDISIIF